MAEPKAPNPKQQLDQGICQQLGWSRRYFQDEATNRWAVEVRTGVGAEGLHRFTSDCDQAGKEGAKQGEAAAAALAVSGLDPIVQCHMAKPAVSMDAAFGAQFDAAARVVEPQSGDGGWGVFWQQNPRVVGIDVEGNSSMPPVLVQVATRSLVVLEAPRGGGRGGRAGSGGDSADPLAGLSPDLRRLLDDRTILKVMCEGSSGADKRSLGLTSRSDIVDLEDVATELAGPQPPPPPSLRLPLPVSLLYTHSLPPQVRLRFSAGWRASWGWRCRGSPCGSPRSGVANKTQPRP
jgi:hypothetical protein